MEEGSPETTQQLDESPVVEPKPENFFQRNRTILLVVAVVVVVLLLVLAYYGSSSGEEGEERGARTGEARMMIPDEDERVAESMRAMPEGRSRGGYEQTSVQQLQSELGHGSDNLSWNEVLKTSELDPATFTNHQDFVKDVRRFSSGANFTSVTDDNTNSAFTNFVGLRRPSHVDIGASARQQPDIDQSVLKRNADLRWGYSAKDSTYLTAEQVGVPAGQYQFESFVNYEK
jgi:hypothetical protein